MDVVTSLAFLDASYVAVALDDASLGASSYVDGALDEVDMAYVVHYRLHHLHRYRR
jgi:hypothetical protein